MSMIPLEMQIKPFILLILLVCFISLNIIFAKCNESIGNKREVRAFKGMLVSFMVYCLVDIRLLVGDSFYTALPAPIVTFIVSVGFGTMSFSCFFWFLHVRATAHFSKKSQKLRRFSLWNVLIHIPLLVDLIFLFTPLHVFIYQFVDGLPVFQPTLLLLLIMDYIYLIVATVISLQNRRRASTRQEKRKYGSQAIFIIFFTISGYLIGFLLNLPAIELCVIPVVLKLFAELQDSQIYTDALTRLYNRRRMNDFISGEVADCTPENPFFVIMIDLDYFKSINDILGHEEGDKALVAFSKALKKALVSKNAVAARWGGDEFVVAGKEPDLDCNFRDWFTVTLKNCTDLLYEPRFSMGAFKCTSSDMAVEQIMSRADEALYREKELHHNESDDFLDQLTVIKKKSS